MATRKKGGGKVVDLTLEVLKDIRGEIRRTNESLEQFRESVDHRFAEQNEKLDRVVERLDTLEEETVRGFTAVRHELDGVNRRLDVTNARIDNV